jgi:hypothetical protein
MPKPDRILFKVVMEKTRNELKPEFIAQVTKSTKTCVRELLAIAGYLTEPELTVGQSAKDWYLTVHVNKKFRTQLDLFASKEEIPTVANAARDVIEAALIAIARFRRETGGIAAATLQETLRQLKSADPRVIAAIARQRDRKLTIRQDETDLELSVQSDSKRTLSSAPEKLAGVIIAVGYNDLFVVPTNRRSVNKLRLHPMRVKIPAGLRARFAPVSVLDEWVRSQRRVQLLVQAELVQRKPPQFTCLLVDWPPA